MDEDERPLSPEETLRLIEQQETVVAKRLIPDMTLHHLAWGAAWFVGFGAFFLHHGLSGTPYARIPITVAMALLTGLMALAMLVSVFTVWQLRSPVHGASQERGSLYGLTWFFGFLAMWMIAVRFGSLLPGPERSLLWASLSMMVVAILYMVSGIVWPIRPMFVLGAGVAVLNAVGTAAGPGWHALLIAVGAGGGSIVTGLVSRRRRRR
ncbi:hypothetical protein GCM10010156_04670 [Planobispora rosea]|uniref:Uncharacterized protein n=1 Tax=Planobispora rosea TaxID=35762 RepID=A0A8J3S0N6_PLARO|nr:hypothetical protein [Planobispora rosea]GGS49075.1 hypothetical protein GCM10010156_04670 [Planobispora rosea]GIH83751.1 hypothetical protein Pro02_21590 [Planobispora rosea]